MAPTAKDETAATEINWGKLGSIIPEAISPVAKTVRSGKKTVGLNKDSPPFFVGALSNGDSLPS